MRAVFSYGHWAFLFVAKSVKKIVEFKLFKLYRTRAFISKARLHPANKSASFYPIRVILCVALLNLKILAFSLKLGELFILQTTTTYNVNSLKFLRTAESLALSPAGGL